MQNYLFLLLFIIFIIIINKTQAQLPPNTTGYNCKITTTNDNHCQTFLVYRAKAPSFLNLAAVADLFSVSRLMISKPSNLSSPSNPLVDDQPLFVPISCSCNSVNDTNNHNTTTNSRAISYANISYTIEPGNTYYLVSTEQFQNLTTYQSVTLVNPSLNPLNLSVGVDVVFPIFCKCPNKTQMGNGVRYLVSYVFRPFDDLASVASLFGVSVQSIVEVNGNGVINPSDTIFVPVSQLPKLSQPVVVSPKPGSGKNDDKKFVVYGLSAGLGITSFLLVVVCGVLFCREKSLSDDDKERQTKVYKRNNNYNKNDHYQLNKEMEESLMADVSGCLDKYRVFGIDEIEEATNGFNGNFLVQGSVYKGSVDGQLFAIKKMNWNACEELKILQKVNHSNLVKLEGFCIDPSNANCFLIYELVENGSLDSWLHGNRRGKLNWKTRLRIAVDVANGLQYIHEHTIPRVVHKDIKSSNILLDANMRAKIANFGLAKSGCNPITMHIVGTQGYIAPEYLSDGVVSTKMDVFSFGVVLLELVSGKEVVGEKGHVLWEIAGRVLEGSDEDEKVNRVRAFVDRDFEDETCSMESLMSVMALALACLNRDPSKRPSMVDIVYVLCKSDDLFYDISDDTLGGSLIVAR